MATNNSRQALWVAIGSLFSYGFTIATAMVLSRYMSKGDYGTYKQVLYVYTILLSIFAIGFPRAYAYFLPNSPKNEAKSLINKITYTLIGLGSILSVLLFVFSGYLADALSNPALESALKIFSPVPLLMMPTLGLEGIMGTYKRTYLLMTYTITTRLAMFICVVIPVVALGYSYEGAIIGFTCSSIVAFLLAYYLKSYPVRNEANDSSCIKYQQIFAFSLPLLFATIWGILINSVDQFFISRYYGTEVFADFSNGAVELPFVSMVVGACTTVLTPLFTKHMNDGRNFRDTMLPVWLSAFRKSVLLIYPLAFFCFFDAESVMVVLYGGAYASSTAFFRIKLFTYIFKIISFYAILIAMGAVNVYAIGMLITFVTIVPSMYGVLLIFNNPEYLIATHVLIKNLLYIGFLIYIGKKLRIPMLRLIPIGTITKVAICSVLSLLAVYLFNELICLDLIPLWSIVFDLAIFGSLYILISIPLGLDYLGIIKPILKK